MSKIIGVDFGARMREDAKPDRSAEAEPRDGVHRIETSPKLKFFNFKQGLGNNRPVWQNGNYLMEHFHPSPEKFTAEKQRVRSLSTAHLIGKLESSTEADWARNPEFFQAVYLELDARLFPK